MDKEQDIKTFEDEVLYNVHHMVTSIFPLLGKITAEVERLAYYLDQKKDMTQQATVMIEEVCEMRTTNESGITCSRKLSRYADNEGLKLVSAPRTGKFVGKLCNRSDQHDVRTCTYLHFKE